MILKPASLLLVTRWPILVPSGCGERQHCYLEATELATPRQTMMEGGHDGPAPASDFTNPFLGPSPGRATPTTGSPRRPSRTRRAAPASTQPPAAFARPALDPFELPPRRRAKRQRPSQVVRERTATPVGRPGVGALAWVLGGALLCGGGGGAMGAQAAVAFLHSSVARTGGGCGAREAGVRVGVGAARAHTQLNYSIRLRRRGTYPWERTRPRTADDEPEEVAKEEESSTAAGGRVSRRERRQGSKGRQMHRRKNASTSAIFTSEGFAKKQHRNKMAEDANKSRAAAGERFRKLAEEIAGEEGKRMEHPLLPEAEETPDEVETFDVHEKGLDTKVVGADGERAPGGDVVSTPEGEGQEDGERGAPDPTAGGKQRETKGDGIRMRRFLPGARAAARAEHGSDVGAGVSPLADVAAAAAAEARTAPDVSRVTGADAGLAAVAGGVFADGAGAEQEAAGAKKGGGNRSTASRSSKGTRHQRRCPPAVGFVSGFRGAPLDDTVQGGGSVAVNGEAATKGKGRPVGVDALIRALCEPVKPRSRQHLVAPPHEETAGVGRDNNGAFYVASESGSGARKSDPHEKHRKSYVRAAADGNLLNPQSRADRSRLDPPMNWVSVRFDPEADTLMSSITTNSDVYGEALSEDKVRGMSRPELAAYLERWVLIAVKHGVAPRELRALVLGEQPDALNLNSARIPGAGLAAGALAGRFKGDAAGKPASNSSWTKYGWKRLDAPSSRSKAAASSSAVSGSDDNGGAAETEVSGPGGSGGVGVPGVAVKGVEEGQEDEELEEEEMENVAAALVGGDGTDNWGVLVDGGSPRGAAAESRGDISKGDRVPGRRQSVNGEVGAAGAVMDGEEDVGSLGWRVLEAVEARFASRVHPPRIIAIGDVHGCLDELKDLVRKVEYWPGDLLLFLGDLVAKGPNSAGVVRLARELGGVAVRGNHEFEVLRWLNVGEKPGQQMSAHHAIAASLSEEDGAWLKSSPWYFRCDALKALFVHAGFVAGVGLRQQNPRMMMNLRSIASDGTATSKVLEARPWAREWGGPETVFFGHDAERGLQLLDNAVGIDTGCVYGGRLTACILPDRRLVSVASRAAYMIYRKRRYRDTRGDANGSEKGNGSDKTKGSSDKTKGSDKSNGSEKTKGGAEKPNGSEKTKGGAEKPNGSEKTKGGSEKANGSDKTKSSDSIKASENGVGSGRQHSASSKSRR